MASFKPLKHWIENKAENVYLKLTEKDHLDDLYVLRDCHTLYIQAPSLRVIPEQLKDFQKLQRLYFYNCPISTVVSFIFYLPSLELLHFKNCIVSKIEYQNGVSVLKNLKINQGLVKEISQQIINLSQLKELDLGSNQITSIPQDFYQLENLTHLNLESNQIQDFSVEIFNMQSLKSICLDNNPLSEKSKELFVKKTGRVI